MQRVTNQNTVYKVNHWVKEKLVYPNLYCALVGVAALVVIETVIFAG